MSAPVVVPWQDCRPFGAHRTGALAGISEGQITEVLGFAPTRHSVEGKTDQEWRFTAGGAPCAIWDFKRSGRNGMWSTFGPPAVFLALFGERTRP